jgi:hypothetical protein
MPSLDVAMPLALLIVVIVALLLNKRAENKLVASVEQKEFKTRDIFLLIIFIAIAISVIAFTSMISPGDLFPNILMLVFLSSYTMLIFTFSHVFSNVTSKRTQLLSAVFGTISLIVGLTSLTNQLADAYTPYRVAAFLALALVGFGVAAYEQTNRPAKVRWYLAAQPPALFVLLFTFFNILYGGTLSVWFPILMDVFGFTFAILIILYLSSLFNWKTVGIFAVLLTVLDVILVFSGPMVTAARTFTGLGLPVLVYLPNFPIITQAGEIALRGLGLGDFFFAGILAVQTFKRFGQKTGLISAVAMAVAFGIWEAFLPEITTFFNIEGFPATVCIITGWLPVIAWKLIATRNQPEAVVVVEQQQPTPSTKPQANPL